MKFVSLFWIPLFVAGCAGPLADAYWKDADIGMGCYSVVLPDSRPWSSETTTLWIHDCGKIQISSESSNHTSHADTWHHYNGGARGKIYKQGLGQFEFNLYCTEIRLIAWEPAWK